MPDTVSGGGDRAVKQPREVPAHGAHFPKEGQTFNKHTEEKSKKKKNSVVPISMVMGWQWAQRDGVLL